MWSWGEFDSNLFHQFCVSRGIILRFSCPQTSSQNDKSDRKIRSINNIIRTLLCYASLPPYFWPYALNTATYLINILPSKLLGHLTPIHFLYQKTPSYDHLRVFGCLCFPWKRSLMLWLRIILGILSLGPLMLMWFVFCGFFGSKPSLMVLLRAIRRV